MRVLIAEDDATSRTLLTALLRRWGFEVLATDNGAAALRELAANPDIALAICDWMMPEIDGITLCRRVRAEIGDLIYIILLTANSTKGDIATGLEAGANDYVVKPFDAGELRARLVVGERTISLKRQLVQKVEELQEALAHVKQLQGIIPICMHCKKIRSDDKAWHEIDRYMADHTDARFSHGICAACLDKYHPE
jgi:DNA-binding response OmpR family regulator